jgi:hypothetical protein
MKLIISQTAADDVGDCTDSSRTKTERPSIERLLRSSRRSNLCTHDEAGLLVRPTCGNSSCRLLDPRMCCDAGIGKTEDADEVVVLRIWHGREARD